MDNSKVVYFGSDHAGFEVKDKLKDFLEENGYKTIDLGVFSEDPADYPDIAREVGEKVYETPESYGVLICGTGIGMCMAANKMHGIRAALATNVEMARATRKHNNANILSLGARVSSFDEMKEMLAAFLETDFEKDAERHVRRVEKLDSLGSKNEGK